MGSLGFSSFGNFLRYVFHLVLIASSPSLFLIPFADSLPCLPLRLAFSILYLSHLVFNSWHTCCVVFYFAMLQLLPLLPCAWLVCRTKHDLETKSKEIALIDLSEYIYIHVHKMYVIYMFEVCLNFADGIN